MCRSRSYLPPRPRHGHSRKARQIDLRVDGRGVEASMAQQVGDLLESSAALHHPARNRVSQDMGSTNTVFEATAPGGVANGIADDVQVGWRIVRRPMSHE